MLKINGKVFPCLILFCTLSTKIFWSIAVYKINSSSSQPLEHCLQQTYCLKENSKVHIQTLTVHSNKTIEDDNLSQVQTRVLAYRQVLHSVFPWQLIDLEMSRVHHWSSDWKEKKRKKIYRIHRNFRGELIFVGTVHQRKLNTRIFLHHE